MSGNAERIGVVHFGPGAFHRAHQADFIDRLLHEDPRWGIVGVSLRSGDLGARLQAQGNHYTLAVLDAEPSFRTIRAHRGFLGPTDTAAIRRTLADSAVKLVTCTVTEKGYSLGTDGRLDFDRDDVRHDLCTPDGPATLVGWLALALRDRRDAGAPAFATLSCDNLADNGRKLRGAVIDHARRLDPALADWIAGEAVFPNAMVDSITPATTDALRAAVRQGHDPTDREPVGREAYAAWVIEDCLPPGGPDLAGAGVVMTSDLAGWEQAKLRLLNGAHSTLAYLGLLLGHETVSQAIEDPDLGEFVETLMADDLASTLVDPPVHPPDYVADLLARFRNPAIAHRLEQIAQDGSQKLPYRLIAPLLDRAAEGAPVDRIAFAIAGWIAFVRARARDKAVIVDPLSARLHQSSLAASDALVDSLPETFPPALRASPFLRSTIANAVARIEALGPRAALIGFP